MERGQIGGRTYKMDFPSYQQQAASVIPPQQQAQINDYVPAMDNDPLAVRRQLTSNYYNNYALLKNIVKDALAQGIDPFQPDYSQDGGGLAFQAAQEAQAGVMYAANALKMEGEKEKQLIPLLAQNKIRLNQNVDQNADMWATQGQYHSTEPLPFVNESNKFSAENTYTSQDSQRFNQNYFDRASKQIDDMVKAGQMSPEEAQLQKAALQKNTNQVYAPSYFDRGDSGDSNQTDYLSLHKSLTNHTRGVWEPNSFKPLIVKGQNYNASEKFKGSTFGAVQVVRRDKDGNETIQTAPNKIKYTLKDKYGDVYFLYENGSMEKVSDLTPDEVTKRFIEGQSAYGGANALPKFYSQLEKAGFINANSRTIPTNTVYGEDGQDVSNLQNQSKPIERMNRIYTDHKDKYDKVINGDLDRFNIVVPNGGAYSFGYDEEDKGFYLVNYKERGYNSQNRPEKLTWDQFNDFLDSLDYWNKKYNNPAELKKAQSTPPERKEGETQAAYDLRLIRWRRENK